MPVIRRVPQDYLTVESAYAAAESGDIIYLSKNVTECLVIEKAVHLVGGGGLSVPTLDESNGYKIYFARSSSKPYVIRYNLTPAEAAKVPFLLTENLVIEGRSSDAEYFVLNFTGSTPSSGFVFNRCAIISPNWSSYTNRSICFTSSGNLALFSRCRIGRRTDGTTQTAFYSTVLPQTVNIDKCWIRSTNWVNPNFAEYPLSDYITESSTTEGYGTTVDPSLVLRWEDLDYEALRLYGTVTDIPDFVEGTDFEIRLYPEKTPQGNDMGFYPIEMVPLSWVTDNENGTWNGSWEFNYLLPTRRYGVLINPPDGMQGHWLRWYNPAVE